MFSNDLVAVEAQNAPLWEQVGTHNTVEPQEETPRIRRSCKSKYNVRPVKRKRDVSIGGRSSSEGSSRSKKNKMVPPFTECRLCELQFQSELELEEHLVSMLHHRAWNTEQGNRRACLHRCNLCNVSTSSLADYMNHLTGKTHKNTAEKRKRDIEKGIYDRPRHDLQKYVSTFTHQSRKQSCNGKETTVDVAKVNPQQPGKSQRQSRRGRSKERAKSNKHGYGTQSNFKGQQYYDSWNLYGHSSTGYPGYSYPYNEDGGWGQTADPYHWYYAQNPYNRYQRRGEMYWQNDDPPILDDEFPKPLLETPAVPARSSSYDTSRTERLIAGAHQVIQNGKKESAKSSVSSPNLHTREHKAGMQNNRRNSTQGTLVPYKGQNGSEIGQELAISEYLAYDQRNSCSNSNGPDPIQPRMVKSELGSSLDTISNPSSCSITLKSGQQSSSLTGSASCGVSNSGKRCEQKETVRSVPNHCTDQVVNDEQSKLSPYPKDEMSHSTYNGNTTPMVEKFRRQIDVGLAMNPSKLAGQYDDQGQGRQLPFVKSQNVELNHSESQPGTADNIRSKFREILDEIDQPVVSASEIMNEGHNKERDTDMSLSTEYNSFVDTERTTAGESSYDARSDMAIADLAHSNLTTSFRKSWSSMNGRKLPSGAFPGNLTGVDGTSASGPSTSCENVNVHKDDNSTFNNLCRNTNEVTDGLGTPQNEQRFYSSDADTPVNKRRTSLQPNIGKARSRLSNKNKEDVSPDVSSEVKQAKLRKILQKFDRAKKSTVPPKALTPIRKIQKKSVGPRFGIDLHLRESGTSETVGDISTFIMNGNVEEILPGKRMRSLSENDSTVLSISAIKREPPLDRGNAKNSSPQRDKQHNFAVPATSEPVATTDSPVQNDLNSKLLSMSEREETLHAGARLLAVQETSVQAEIEKTFKAVRQLETQLHKLNETKTRIAAAKRHHEVELENLRKQRLAMLRGSVPNGNESSGSIFPEITQNSRWVTSSFSAGVCTHSTPTPDDPQNESPLGQSIPQAGAKGTSDSLPTPTASSAYERQNSAPKGVCSQSAWNPPEVISVPPSTNDGKSPTSLGSVRIKTEPGLQIQDEDGFPLSASKFRVRSQDSTMTQMLDTAKKQTYRRRREQATTPSPASRLSGHHLVCKSQDDFQYHTIQEVYDNSQTKDSSSEFYSLNNTEVSSSPLIRDVDKIISKYTRPRTKTSPLTPKRGNPSQWSPTPDRAAKKITSAQRSKKGSPRKSPQTPAVNPWRSPRNLNTFKTPTRKEKAVVPTTPPWSTSEGKAQESSEVLKAHDAALVGMQLLPGGLVTCSLDKTVILHEWGTSTWCIVVFWLQKFA